MGLAFILVLAAAVAHGATTPQPAATQSCTGLLQLALPNASVTSAEVAGAGTFTTSSAFPDLPAFCRVAATLRPSSDSEIKIEVWLPVAGWNGKFLAMGSGGWGGAIDYKALAYALRQGYAASATDDGHEGPGGSFVLGHPEKFIDFAYRSEHEMTIKAKAIIRSFFTVATRATPIGMDAPVAAEKGCCKLIVTLTSLTALSPAIPQPSGGTCGRCGWRT